MMLETVGWIGGIMFAICGLPQAMQAYKTGHAREITWSFLLLWIGGELLTMAYVLPKGHWPLLFNYIFNIIFIVFIMRYKIWERKC